MAKNEKRRSSRTLLKAGSSRSRRTPKVYKPRSSRKLLGAEDSQTRAALIDAAEDLMREEGYAAATSRGIATRAGLKHQVIFYYFATLDDLLLEVLKRGAEKGLARIAEALDSEQPLRALWQVATAPKDRRFDSEFVALAGHNKLIRAELARYGKKMRLLQTEALSRHLAARGIVPRMPPVLVSVLMTALARLLVTEVSLGIEFGHAEAEALVEACFREFERTGDTSVPPKPLVERR